MYSSPVKVKTSGSAGAASGSAVSGALYGLLSEIWINFNAAAPATTTVTITQTVNGVSRTLLVHSGNSDTVKAVGLPVVVYNVHVMPPMPRRGFWDDQRVALAELAAGNPEAALTHLENALSHSPNDGEALAGRGDVLLQ